MDVFWMSSDDFCMIFGHSQSISCIPSHLRMFPDGFGASQALFGAFRSCRSPKKSEIFKKNRDLIFLFGQKIICWGCSETVFAGFPGHGGSILNGKRSFKVTPPPSEARSERSVVVRTYATKVKLRMYTVPFGTYSYTYVYVQYVARLWR